MDLAPVLICGIVFFSIYKMFELFVRRQERITMIEKISENMNPADIEKQLSSMNPLKITGFSSLKAGALLTGIGLGLLVGYFIASMSNLNASNWSDRGTISVIYSSCVLLFGGISLLIAFAVELKIGKKND